MLMTTLFLERIWFKRGQISGLLHVTTLPPNSTQKNVFKWKISSAITKILLIVSIVYYMCTHFISIVSPLKNDDYLMVKKTTFVVANYLGANFYRVTRLEIVLVFVTSLLMGQQTKMNLELTQGNIQKGLEIYQTLLWKMGTINKIFGNILLAYYLDVIGYCCGIPSALLKNSVLQYPSTFLVSFALDVAGWIIAAEFYHYIQYTFSNWHEYHSRNKSYKHPMIDLGTTCDKCKQMAKSVNAIRLVVERDDIVKIKAEFQYEPLAFSCRFFRITYGFLQKVNTILIILI